MKNRTTSELTLLALLVAIVFVSTYLVQIPMPFSKGGLVHVGDVAFFTIALIFGSRIGAIAGGVGMGLFDLLSPYAIWAPFTFVIRLLMGIIIGRIAHSGESVGQDIKKNIVALLASMPILIGGYYVAEAILYGNWVAPVSSISGNIGQFAVGFFGGLALSKVLSSLKIIENYHKNGTFF